MHPARVEAVRSTRSVVSPKRSKRDDLAWKNKRGGSFKQRDKLKKKEIFTRMHWMKRKRMKTSAMTT